MKRARAGERHVHGGLALEYYKERTSVPGTLAITEGTFIALHAGGTGYRPWHLERRADRGMEASSRSPLNFY